MTLYFAYGSNMSRAGMRLRCPSARALGVATLPGWRFVIGRDGYASIAPAPGERVLGVLWHVSARDVAALNAYEGVDVGLYRQVWVMIRAQGRARSAMVYVARRGGEGRPRPGYLEEVIAAARAWMLPADYVAGLARWSMRGAVGAARAGTSACASSAMS
ncbi:MAG: gamma-glutamylcyclotransferase [Pseudolabrys sp.]|nr:gamma-glutamylcyclotransferase [Pseudolabrys sp.]